MSTQQTRRNDWVIRQVRDREKLAARHDPYWQSLSKGKALGYRKLASGHMSWLGRWTEPEQTDATRKKYIIKTLTLPENTKYADEYNIASDLAAAFFAECQKNWDRRTDKARRTDVETVEDAVRLLYIPWLRVEKGADAAERADRRFARVLYGSTFGQRNLSDLKEHHTQQWVLSLVTPTRKPQSANRIYRQFRAAMKIAKVDRAVWQDVPRFAAEDGRRNAFLKPKQIAEILTACERTKDQEELAADPELMYCNHDLANFVRAEMITAARPNEIAKLKVRDFDAVSGIVTLGSRKNNLGVARTRDFYLTNRAELDFFKRMAKDKLPAAPLLIRADGTSWLYEGGKMHGHPRAVEWSAGLRAAIRDANKHLSKEYQIRIPDEQAGRTTMYTFRHTTITNMLDAGIEMFAVTDVVGTSEAMLRKHYDQNRKNRVREQMKLRGALSGL